MADLPTMPADPQRALEWYRVFKPERDTAAPDPLDPVKRYHDGVFVETDVETGKGTMFHVTGDVIAARGMYYQYQEDVPPQGAAKLHRIEPLGWIRKTDLERVHEILQALPTPPKQQGINFWEKNPVTGRYDLIWTKEDGEPYGPGETRPPTFKCNEWTSLHAIPALREAKILCDSTE